MRIARTVAFLCPLALALAAGSASAQFATPAQGPKTDPVGQLTAGGTIGVVHDGDLDFTDFSILARARYGLADTVTLNGRLGGLLGDADAFVLGGGAKLELLGRDQGDPVDLSGFGQLDFGFGSDTTFITMLLGPLVGTTLDIGGRPVSPYGGIGLGFSYVEIDYDLPFGRTVSADDTEFAFGFIFGGDVEFDERLGGMTELTIGVTDGLPVLNWNLGLTYEL